MSEIHHKAWGYEHWIVNGEYCGKRLVLLAGFRCSMHYHANKDETFHILSGMVLMEVGDKTVVLRPGDSVHIPPTVPHRFTGLDHAEMMEFSTHHEESDSYRLTKSAKIPRDEWTALLRKYAC